MILGPFRIQLFFRWQSGWVGYYWNSLTQSLCVGILPFVVLRFSKAQDPVYGYNKILCPKYLKSLSNKTLLQLHFATGDILEEEERLYEES